MRWLQILPLTLAAVSAAACDGRERAVAATAAADPAPQPVAVDPSPTPAPPKADVPTSAGKEIRGTKTSKGETRNVDPFEKIQASGVFELRIDAGKPQSVLVETGDETLGSVRTETRSNVLYIETTGDLRRADLVRVTVTAPKIDDVRLSGAVTALLDGVAGERPKFEVRASGTSSLDVGAVRADEFNVSLQGTSHVSAKDLRCKTFHLAVDGVTTVNVGGAADELRLDMNGACKAELTELAAKEVSATLDGSGLAEVNVSASLHVRAQGASKLLYVGNPPQLTKDAQPPAEVRPK